MQVELTGNLYVIAAPSGAGKTSLVRALTTQQGHLNVAISHTTRERRPHEVDGKNYHFVSMDQFEKMVRANDFVEHAQVFGNFYGTSWHAITSILHEGEDIILEIDWQGAKQIREVITDCVSVFILPPSLHALRNRLEHRGQDEAQIISQRMAAAIDEISHYNEFDYLVVNDRFETALEDLRLIVSGHGSSLAFDIQKKKLGPLIDELLAG